MGHESQIFFPSPLHIQRLLGGICLDSYPNRLIEEPVHYMEGLALQVQTVLLGEIMNTAAQDIVFGNDFLKIKGFLETLQAVRWGAAFSQSFRNCLVGF